MSPIRRFGVADAQALQDAAEQGRKDAAAAVEKGWSKGYGARMREIFNEERNQEIIKANKIASQQDLNSLWTAIREFVWAETRLAVARINEDKDEYIKQQEQSSRMETSVREQLEILNMRIASGQMAARKFTNRR